MAAELSGKTAIVTGASRGIGAAVAQRFAAEGAQVALVARTFDRHASLPGSLEETRQKIVSGGGIASSFATDLRDEAARDKMIDAVRSEFGAIDILINNAAANYFLPFDKIGSRHRHIIFEINCHAPFHLMQRVLPDMLNSGRGWIVNISSRTSEHPDRPYNGFARQGYPSLYGMSKAALERLTAGLAAEFCDKNIAFNCLAPVAAVATPGALALGYRPVLEELEGEEVMAEAALVLAQVDASGCSGRCLLSGEFLNTVDRIVKSLDGTTVWDGRIAGFND